MRCVTVGGSCRTGHGPTVGGGHSHGIVHWLIEEERHLAEVIVKELERQFAFWPHHDDKKPRNQGKK